ncbi:hypothetical protein B0H12DRAFT_272113 [Mycena haematopus]|nr:hypothetical protein B0H12DRAFT_272113 [Mycena haematopus]
MNTGAEIGNDSPLNSVYTPNRSRVSSFCSPELEVLLYSTHVRTEPTSWASSRSIPVYGDRDVVGGKITIAPNCPSGRVVLDLLGTFVSNPMHPDVDGGKQRHIFFSASKIIHLTSESDISRKGIRKIFTSKSRQSRSTSIIAVSETRTFPFAFDLGGKRLGEILPTTLYPSHSNSVEVSYQVTATWEPLKLTRKPSFLRIPIIVQSDPDFHSLDTGQSSWIEIPLKAHRPVPVRCAVTLPSSLAFTRASSIPFFVVFTTTPCSPILAREIAGDATITVSVRSVVSVVEESQATTTGTESVLSDRSSDSRSSRLTAKLFRGLQSKTSFSSFQASSYSHSTQSKPLPRLPSRTIFSDTQTVYSGMSIGFPKRPRHSSSSSKARPSLDEVRSIPDGLYKDKIPLGRDILTSFNWGGISVKYYFEVSVLLGQDELRAKVLLRII